MFDWIRFSEICESLGWSISGCGDKDIELEKRTSLGENYSFVVSKDNPVGDIKLFAMNYDPDDHVEPLVPIRGKYGVPTSIKALIDDAVELGNDLDTLAKVLEDELC